MVQYIARNLTLANYMSFESNSDYEMWEAEIQASDASVEADFTMFIDQLNSEKYKDAVRDAVEYVAKKLPIKILEPGEFPIDQPYEQTKLIADAENALGLHVDGAARQERFRENLRRIRGFDGNEAQLIINDGFEDEFDGNPRIDDSILTECEKYRLCLLSSDYEELIDQVSQTNTYFSKLIKVTGAGLVYTTPAENGSFERIYKGMLEDKPVYFHEKIDPAEPEVDPPLAEVEDYSEIAGIVYPQPTPELIRRVSIISESQARMITNAFTEEDFAVIDKLGMEISDIDMMAAAHGEKFTRTEMVGLIKACAVLIGEL